MRRSSYALAVAGLAFLFSLAAPTAFADPPGSDGNFIGLSDHNLNASATHEEGGNTTDSSQEDQQSPTVAKPSADDPAPQGWQQFVVGPDCTRPHQSCLPLPQGVCATQQADYEQRQASDPTIPEEDWEVGHVIHYSATGDVLFVEPPSCRNTADSDPDPANPVELPQVTDGDVATAFQTIPLPVPTARMSPAFPACVHLNMPNYVYVDPVDTDPITITLLGTPVTVYPRIIDYTWNFGDNQQLTTTDPGKPYPDGTVSHIYRKSGRYQVTVTVRWAADWQSPTHPRSAVPGEADTTSQPGIAWAHAMHVVLLSDPHAVLPAKPHDPADACYQQ